MNTYYINDIKLKKLMAKNKINTVELSEAAGVARTTLYYALTMKRRCNIVTLGKIADALDVELEEFVDFKEG